MLHRQFIIRIFIFFFVFLTASAHAQNKKPVGAKAKTVANTIPAVLKLKPLWGNHPGGNMLVADGINYADSALRVIDDKGHRYQVVSFKFIYRRKASITDDQTGAVKNTWDVVATDIYNSNSLTDVWKTTIKETLQKDEEWIIDYITIKDKSGRKVMATPMNFKFK
jgi:hypothetical protein